MANPAISSINDTLSKYRPGMFVTFVVFEDNYIYDEPVCEIIKVDQAQSKGFFTNEYYNGGIIMRNIVTNDTLIADYSKLNGYLHCKISSQTYKYNFALSYNNYTLRIIDDAEVKEILQRNVNRKKENEDSRKKKIQEIMDLRKKEKELK